MGTTSKNPEIPKSLSGKYEDRLWRSKYLTSTQRESEGETSRSVDLPPPSPLRACTCGTASSAWCRGGSATLGRNSGSCGVCGWEEAFRGGGAERLPNASSQLSRGNHWLQHMLLAQHVL